MMEYKRPEIDVMSFDEFDVITGSLEVDEDAKDGIVEMPI